MSAERGLRIATSMTSSRTTVLYVNGTKRILHSALSDFCLDTVSWKQIGFKSLIKLIMASGTAQVSLKLINNFQSSDFSLFLG